MHTKAPDPNAPSQVGPTSTNATGEPQVNGSQPGGSRPRFEQYRLNVKHKKLPKGGIHSGSDARSAKDRVRSAWDLVRRFFALLTPYRGQVFWILASLTAATL